jgi:nitrite reductase/ring-hydroxylating ferredoxin subunit
MADENGETEDSTWAEGIAVASLTEGVLHSRTLPSGKKVVILKEGGATRVFGELCPHMGADMTEATYCAKTGTLQCPWHGYIFSSSDGRFLENPNERLMKLIRGPSEHFKPDTRPNYKLQVLAHHVRDGRLYLGRPPRNEDAVSEAEGATR